MYTRRGSHESFDLVIRRVKPNKSNMCDEGSTQNGELKTKLLIYSGQKLQDSNLCNTIGSQEDNMTHSEGKPHKGRMCDAVSALREIPNNNMLIHVKDKPFNCTVCDKGFTLKGVLKRHLLIHTRKKPCKCSVCDAAFTHKHHLRRHLLTHCGEKPQ